MLLLLLLSCYINELENRVLLLLGPSASCHRGWRNLCGQVLFLLLSRYMYISNRVVRIGLEARPPAELTLVMVHVFTRARASRLAFVVH